MIFGNVKQINLYEDLNSDLRKKPQTQQTKYILGLETLQCILDNKTTELEDLQFKFTEKTYEFDDNKTDYQQVLKQYY